MWRGQGSEMELAKVSEINWNALENLDRPDLAELFGDSGRVDRYAATLELPGGPILFDWSKTHLSAEVEAALMAIAAEQDLEGQRARLLEGAIVNPSEGRAAEHPAQRGI